MTQQDILNKAIEYLKYQGVISSKKDLAEQMGANRVSVSRACSGDPSYLTSDFLHRLNTTFGSVFSPSWLLTGEGEMLRDSVSTKKTVDDEKESKAYTIPLLPVSAQGGSLSNFAESVRESDCEKIISPIKGADFAMPVAGDSMAPEYPAGSQIFIKKINERAFIDWGRVYVLDTCNGTVIKRVYPTDDPNIVECRSINPEYPPFKVSVEDVYGMYRVLMCMSVK